MSGTKNMGKPWYLSLLNQIYSQNRNSIIWILLLNSYTLWFLTIAKTNITEFPADTLYYLENLPVYYWAGIGLNCIVVLCLLGASNISRRTIGLSHCAVILILILYVFGTPLFISKNPMPLDIYGFANIIETLQTPGYEAEVSLYSHYLVNFPGTTLFAYLIVEAIGMPELSLLHYSSLLFMSLLCILIYSLARQISPKYALFAPIAYISCSFVSWYHLCPQQSALFLTLTLMILISFLVHDVLLKKPVKKSMSIKRMILLFILWLVIVVSHPTTPIFNLFSFVILFLTSLLFLIPRSSLLTKLLGLSSAILARIRNLTGILIVLFLVTYTSYLYLRSKFLIDRFVSLGHDIIKDITAGHIFSVTDVYVTEPLPSYMLTFTARWIQIGGILVLGLLSIIILVYGGKKYAHSTFILGSLFVGYMLFAALLVFSGESATEYGPDRTIMFGMIPCSILFSTALATRLMHRYKVLHIFVIAIVVVSLIAVPLVRYSSQPYNFVSDSEFAGRKFASEHPSIGTKTEAFNGYFMKRSPFTNYGYNFYELKQQEGNEYAKSFMSQHKLYDSGQCGIFRYE